MLANIKNTNWVMLNWYLNGASGPFSPFLLIIALSFILFSTPIYATITISTDTTWHSGEFIDTGGRVEIDHSAILTVEGGVTISDYTYFLVLGNLEMKGTEVEPIEINYGYFCFYGNYNTPGYIEFSHVIMIDGSFLDAGYCSGYGSFNLFDSQFYRVGGFYLWYPVAPSQIVRNIFVDSAGLQAILSGSNTLDVLNNIFVRHWGSAVSVYANYGNGLIVRYNSFLSLDKVALQIVAGYSSASMIADYNYFGTTDTANIEERILDRKDSLTMASVIEYQPILALPDHDTPEFILKSYALSISKSGVGSGLITSSPTGISCGSDCIYDYDIATLVSLTATPTDAYSVFDGWSGDDDCEDGQVTMSTNISCIATFNAIRRLAVTPTGKGSGTVTSTPLGINCGATCQAPFYVGTTVKLMAKPDDTSIFAGWSGDASCPNPKLDVDRSCSATFNPKIFRLYTFVVGTGGGHVTSDPAGINCGKDCEEDYVANTLITLTATPDARSSFAGWVGPCTGAALTCQVTMSEVRGVAAIFDLKTYTLSVAKLGDGVVTSNPVGISCGTYCRDTFEDGTPVSLTALPALGSGFVKWSGACTGTGRVCTVTMNAAKKVTATFVPLKITINDVTQSEGNSGTRTFKFTVGLNASTHRTVKVSFATRNGTAQAGTDYNARTGLVAFTADQIAKPLGIAVRGDIVKESNETFFVNLATPVGGTFAKQQGRGIITNDD